MGGNDKGASAPLMGKGKDGGYGETRAVESTSGGRRAPRAVPRAAARGGKLGNIGDRPIPW